MFRPLTVLLATLAWRICVASGVNASGPGLTPANTTDLALVPWTSLGITADDAVRFSESGVSPADGAQIIATETALFNGTQASNVIGAVSAATAMGLGGTSGSADLKLVVIVGWRRQHVGITYKKGFDLSLRFRDALYKLCPEGNGPERACYYQEEGHIKDIFYNVGANGHLGITVASYDMPSQYRSLFITTLWGVFKEITNCDANRYQLRGFGPHHEACREFANSADQIEVRLEGTRGPGQRPGLFKDPHLRVNIKFNGKTDEGPFDCVGAQSLIWDRVRSRMLPKVKEISAFQDASVDFDALCVSPVKSGGCADGEDGHQVICKSDSRWTDKPGVNGEDGSCHWHNRCLDFKNCAFVI